MTKIFKMSAVAVSHNNAKHSISAFHLPQCHSIQGVICSIGVRSTIVTGISKGVLDSYGQRVHTPMLFRLMHPQQCSFILVWWLLRHVIFSLSLVAHSSFLFLLNEFFTQLL